MRLNALYILYLASSFSSCFSAFVTTTSVRGCVGYGHASSTCHNASSGGKNKPVFSIRNDGTVTPGEKVKLSKPSISSRKKPRMSKKERQRTGNGTVDSSKEDMAPVDCQDVQVLEAKRGNKVVTIVRGMQSGMQERKSILKEIKKALGAGGTIVEGVLEVQGAYSEKVVSVLKKKGYTRARKIGK